MIRKFLVILVLLFSFTAYSQPTARDHYNEGMRLLKLCISETRSQANCKKNCQMAIGQFNEVIKLDAKWQENVLACKQCCQKILENPYPRKKKGVENITLPSFIPFLAVSSPRITIDAEGKMLDTLSITSRMKWDVNVSEESFLLDHFKVKNGCVMLNLDQNPSFNDRIDTLYISTTDDDPYVERVIVVQQASPIIIHICIDNDGVWYDSAHPEKIPAIEVAKFRDEFRSIFVEMYPHDAAVVWMKDAQITLPDWCDRLTEHVDTRSGLSSLIKLKEFKPELKYGEIHFKSLKQQKKKGTSGVARNGEITISYQDATLTIPICQNQ